jgi:glutamate/tyrosine decarboxylase-like PLP-dependent enzyme
MLVKGVEREEKLELLMRPIMNIVGIKAKHISVRELSLRMRRLGWLLSEFPTHLRVVLMPHHTQGLVERLLKDLKRATLRGCLELRATLKT